MTVMIAEVYDAFIAAGAPKEKARRAAEALCSTEPRFDALDRRIDRLDADLNSKIDHVEASLIARIDRFEAKLSGKIDGLAGKFEARFVSLEGETTLTKWMLGFTLAFLVTITLKPFLAFSVVGRDPLLGRRRNRRRRVDWRGVALSKSAAPRKLTVL